LNTAADIITKATGLGLTLALAESCTAGLASSLLVEIPGASKVLWGSFITYTVQAKAVLLGIDPALIQRYGAVSGETALAMARGALQKSGADLALSITGLAGPEGDGSGQPVGTVFIAQAWNKQNRAGDSQVYKHYFEGGRNTVRQAAAEAALTHLISLLDNF
jgi:PncC family amidohydrolase